MGSLVWKLSALVEYHEELVGVVTLVELWGARILMDCHEVSGGWNDQHLLICGQRDRRLMRV